MSGVFTSLTSAKIQSPIKEDRKQKYYILKHLFHIIIEHEATLRSGAFILSEEKNKMVRQVDGKRMETKISLR